MSFPFSRFTMPDDYSCNAESLASPFARHIEKKGIDVDCALIVGVGGTKRLLIERTHGHRATTFAAPLLELIRSPDAFILTGNDPFVYALAPGIKAPTIVVYDGRLMEYEDEYFQQDSEELDGHKFGGEFKPVAGELDDVTLLVVMLKEPELHR